MKSLAALLIVAAFSATALAEAPDISKAPPHPRLYIGGLETAAGYIDPDSLTSIAKTRPEDWALLNNARPLSARALSAMVSVDAKKFRQVVADLKSAKATSGGELVELALAYDWIAADLAEPERKEIARHIGDLAAGPVSQYITRSNAFDNNSLRRDMGIGLAALAIAGDDPRAQQLLNGAHRIFDEFIEITGDHAAADDMAGRGGYGGGWPEGHDYDRHGSRYAFIYFLGLRSATGVDVFKDSPFWKAKILEQIYIVLPNGINNVPFQDSDNPFIHRFDREMMLVLAREFGDPHARYYLNHVNTEKVTSSAIFDFLYNQPNAPEHDYSDLPKALYIPGTGLVYARSGWGPNDTYVAFCASDWYVYHQNDAQNVFAIYRNAPLAVKDGVYDGEMHTQYVDYSIRTISYCGMTVFDPAETYNGPDPIPHAVNDGGQMIQQWTGDAPTVAEWRKQAHRTDGPMRDIVDWKGFETNDTYTYMAAEASRAYKPGKVPFFSRQVVFIYPNWVIVFDRVTAGNADFAKTFRIHAPEEMEVSAAQAIITTRKTNHTTIPGRLFVQSLLPATAALTRVDGLSMVNGESFVGPDPYGDQLYCPHHLEISTRGEKTSYFLTAMYASDAGVEKAPDAKIVEETPDKVTLSLDGGHVLSFDKTGDVAWQMLK